jgi:hypothetical protein
MTDDGTGNRTLAAARMGGSGTEGEDDRGQGEFQFRIHDGSSLCKSWLHKLGFSPGRDCAPANRLPFCNLHFPSLASAIIVCTWMCGWLASGAHSSMKAKPCLR